MSELESTCYIAPWEEVLRWRCLAATRGASALLAGRRTDRDAVLRHLWAAWDNLSFLLAVHPEHSASFIVETLRGMVAEHIEALESQLTADVEADPSDDDEQT